MSRRRGARTSDLTSLLDVLFILVFAALVHAAGREPAPAEAAPEPEPPPEPVAPPAPDAAVAEPEPALPTPELAGRTVALVRVSRHGVVTAIETADGRHEVGLALVEPSPDPDVVLVYLGDRSPDLRVCRIAALTLGVPDLAEHVVVITPERPLSELTFALAGGLTRDVGRCLEEQAGLALLVDPGFTP